MNTKIKQRLLIYLAFADRPRSLFRLCNELKDLTPQEIHVSIEGIDTDGYLNKMPLTSNGKPLDEYSYYTNDQGHSFLKKGGYLPTPYQRCLIYVKKNNQWVINGIIAIGFGLIGYFAHKQC